MSDKLELLKDGNGLTVEPWGKGYAVYGAHRGIGWHWITLEQAARLHLWLQVQLRHRLHKDLIEATKKKTP